MFNYLIEEYDVAYLVNVLQKQGSDTADRIANSLISQTRSWNDWERKQAEFQAQEIFTGIWDSVSIVQRIEWLSPKE